MEESYKQIDDSTEVKANIVTVMTTKLKDFMTQFERQELQQSKVDQNSEFKKPIFLVDDMQSTFINMKRSFQYVGDNSTYQKRITWILVIQWITYSFMANSMAFFFRTPVFLCKIPLTQIFIACSQTVACPLINTQDVIIRTSSTDSYFNFYQVSISQQFALYCQNSDLAPWAQSLFFFGGFISGYLFSYFSQKVGRRQRKYLYRLNLICILILLIVSMLICSIAPNFQVFMIGYFFIGFSLFGYQTSIYIYIGQISAIRFRTISINMLTMTWAATPIFLPLLGFIPTWRYTFMLFAIMLLTTLPFVYYCFLQSPRFLLSKKCYCQARQIFQQISITNRRPPYNFKLIQQIQAENQTYLTYQPTAQLANDFVVRRIFSETTKAYNYFDLFKFPSLRKPTIILMYWWIFRFFMYYGLNLALQSVLKSGFLLTMIISGAAIMQVLGSFGIAIMTTFLYNKYKLDIMRICLLIITLCCFCLWFLQIGTGCVVYQANSQHLCFELVLMLILVILLKFFNTVFYSGLLVYYSQIFPTPVRSLGCGFTLTFGRLGTIIVPFYINYMKVKYYGKNSLCFLAPFGIFAFLLCYIMPYTQKQGMKEKIKQQEDLNVFQMVQF